MKNNLSEISIYYIVSIHLTLLSPHDTKSKQSQGVPKRIFRNTRIRKAVLNYTTLILSCLFLSFRTVYVTIDLKLTISQGIYSAYG